MPGAPEGHLSNENRWLRSIRALWIISDKTEFDEPRRLKSRHNQGTNKSSIWPDYLRRYDSIFENFRHQPVCLEFF